MNRFFRIHGDNIIECERSLTLVAEAFNVKPVWDKSAPIYKPIYVFEIGNEKYVFELLPGHDRWGVDFVIVIIQAWIIRLMKQGIWW